MSQEYPLVLANIEEEGKFIQLYPKFCAALPAIVELTNRVTQQPSFEDPDPDRGLANALILELAILTFEDFDEVVLLCADGHPRGGLKILRGMFERSVTLFEIDQHPEKAKRFYGYQHLDRFKIAMRFEEECPGRLPKEKLEEIRANRDAVKDDYMRSCKSCGYRTPSGSWMESDIVEVAARLGLGGNILLHAYYDALHETHPKMGAIRLRLRQRGDASQADTGAGSVSTAHFLLLENVRAMIERFRMKELEELYQRCKREYREAWPAKVGDA